MYDNLNIVFVLKVRRRKLTVYLCAAFLEKKNLQLLLNGVDIELLRFVKCEIVYSGVVMRIKGVEKSIRCSYLCHTPKKGQMNIIFTVIKTRANVSILTP